MATTTTNFGWDIPQSTDLVKDGATAIAALGQDIDTALVDLKGGTTGQILAKASNTDLDYSWITNDVGDITAVTAGTGISGGGTSGDVTITNSMATAIDAKGDLIAGTGADAFSRLAVGANDTILVGDSTAATGLAYKSAATLYGWTTWTPTYSGITVGNGSVVARYSQIGKTVTLYFQLSWGSTTSVSSYGSFTLPVTANKSGFTNGNVTFVDAGVQLSPSVAYLNSTTDAYFVATQTSANYTIFGPANTTTPFAFANGDQWVLQMTYEAA